MPEYVVERYWPGVTDLEVRDLVDRLNRATAENRTAQNPPVARAGAVSYLGSTLMLDDELVCCRFDAESAQDVADLNGAAGLRYDRILLVHPFPQG